MTLWVYIYNRKYLLLSYPIYVRLKTKDKKSQGVKGFFLVTGKYMLCKGMFETREIYCMCHSVCENKFFSCPLVCILKPRPAVAVKG